jgi:3-phosphoshikimate 1-carboxyvinyltransferase
MRDHTLRMARLFGASVTTTGIGGDPVDHIIPSSIERDLELRVPGDISSAAFLIGAALLVPGSSVRLVNVGLNPSRIALLQALVAMGARLRWDVEDEGFEPVGTVSAAFSPEMEAITLDGRSPFNVAEMLDELPLLALLAARAKGRSTVRDAAELRVKESDRIAATAALLASFGIAVEEHEDGFAVEGPQSIGGGVTVDHRGDHRLCMVAALAALVAAGPVTIPDPDAAAVSYPAFWSDLALLAGAPIGEPA